MMAWVPRLVALTRASIYTKLLIAFLAIVALMLASGLVGLRALSQVNTRAEDMVQLQRKIAAYRQLNHDTIGQLYSVASSLLKPEDRTLEATLRQLNQFGYDLDRLQFVAQDEKELFIRVRQDYEEFIRIVTQVVELIRSGRAVEGRDLQLTKATPLADRLERLTNELVNKAESDMVASIEASHDAYLTSRHAVIAFAVVSIGLALLLGYAISSSLINPVTQMEARMNEIAAGDFSKRVDVPNRDELGVLAANLNRMSDELGTRLRPTRSHQPSQVGIPGQHVTRAAHTAQCRHRILGGSSGEDVRRPQREATRVCTRHPRFRAPSTLPDQRHSRLVENRSRKAGTGARTGPSAEHARRYVDLGPRARRSAWAGSSTVCRRANRRDGSRRAQGSTDSPQLALQRSQIHPRRRKDRCACDPVPRQCRDLSQRHRHWHRRRGSGGNLPCSRQSGAPI